jgi:hypothetical protein
VGGEGAVKKTCGLRVLRLAHSLLHLGMGKGRRGEGRGRGEGEGEGESSAGSCSWLS